MAWGAGGLFLGITWEVVVPWFKQGTRDRVSSIGLALPSLSSVCCTGHWLANGHRAYVLYVNTTMMGLYGRGLFAERVVSARCAFTAV